MSRKERKKKVYSGLPKVEVYHPNLDAFYQFMYDRHMIYVNRFVLKQPPPWTTNPILRDYKFTNVYRELDRGTIWYMDHIAPRIKDLRDAIWLTTMYRLVNRIETFKTCGLISLNCWRASRKNWRHHLKKLHQKSIVFTNAHLTLPTRQGKSKIDTYISSMDWLYKNIDKMAQRIAVEESPSRVFEILQDIPGVGSFIAYEIWCDLVLAKLISFTENDFVNAGPGCRVGIKLIYPLVGNKQYDYVGKITRLQQEQLAHFTRLGLLFPFLHHKPLTLRSIEHSLCEFSKYRKMTEKTGKQRMYFKPQTGEDPRGKQIIMRFPRTKVLAASA